MEPSSKSASSGASRVATAIPSGAIAAAATTAWLNPNRSRNLAASASAEWSTLVRYRQTSRRPQAIAPLRARSAPRTRIQVSQGCVGWSHDSADRLPLEHRRLLVRPHLPVGVDDEPLG